MCERSPMACLLLSSHNKEVTVRMVAAVPSKRKLNLTVTDVKPAVT